MSIALQDLPLFLSVESISRAAGVFVGWTEDLQGGNHPPWVVCALNVDERLAHLHGIENDDKGRITFQHGSSPCPWFAAPGGRPLFHDGHVWINVTPGAYDVQALIDLRYEPGRKLVVQRCPQPGNQVGMHAAPSRRTLQIRVHSRKRTGHRSHSFFG